MEREIKMTDEMIEKLKAVKSSEEVLALAREYNIDVSEEEAKLVYAQINPPGDGELSEDQLDAVAGGNVIDKYVQWVGSLFGR